MGIAERREREKEALRTMIVEAARDIISENGVDALSMRSLAERIEYSPGTIYLYFRDKNELLGEVIRAGFELMEGYIRAEMEKSTDPSNPKEQHRSLGRAYARFGLENTAYFRVMFELPAVPNLAMPECGEAKSGEPIEPHLLEATIQQAMDAGMYERGNAKEWALLAWGLIHGVTSLYLTGHLGAAVSSHDEFLELVERAMDSLGRGMLPRETGVTGES